MHCLVRHNTEARVLVLNIIATTSAASDRFRHCSDQCLRWVISGHFAMRDRCPLYPPKADICSAKRHVRFTPKSGHVQRTSRCPLCAKSGHPRNYQIGLECTCVPLSASRAILGGRQNQSASGSLSDPLARMVVGLDEFRNQNVPSISV